MIQKLLTYLILLLILPELYIYFIFIRKMTKSIILRYSYFIPNFLLLCGILYIVFANERFLSDYTIYINRLTIAYMVIVFPKTLFSICSLIDIPLKHFFKRRFYPFSLIGIIGGLVCAGIIIYGATIGKTKFEVKKQEVKSYKLPQSFDKYKIVQISDIHIGSWKGNPEAIKTAVNIINQQNADLIVFTGDLVNRKADELNGFEEILSKLKSKDGVYSILGNHDYGTYYNFNTPEELAANLKDLKQRQAKMGWKMLNNEHVMLHRGSDSIALIGVENEGEPPFSQHADLKKAMKGADTPFKILLTHNPTHWRKEVLDTDIRLTLSGHTHAMQLDFNHHSPASYIYPEWSGTYYSRNQMLYVNVGLGFVGIPIRLGAWPEITVFTLHYYDMDELIRLKGRGI